MAGIMFSALLDVRNYNELKRLSAERNVSMARLLNEVLREVLPQIKKEWPFFFARVTPYKEHEPWRPQKRQ